MASVYCKKCKYFEFMKEKWWVLEIFQVVVLPAVMTFFYFNVMLKTR